MNTIKRRILLLGKLPPPYMGPSVAFEIIIHSRIKDIYDLEYLDIKANDQLNTLGKWSWKKLFRNFEKYIELKKILIKHKPELVLIPVSQSAIGFIKDAIFILISSRNKARVIVQLRGGNFRNWYDNSPLIIKKFTGYILSKTNGVIVQGNNLKILFKDFYNNENIFVVPNGADIKFESKPEKKSDKIKITYLGNLQSSKGIEDLISAAILLNQTHKNKFEIDVVGSWRSEVTKENCLKQVSENHLPVIFHNSKTGADKFRQLLNSDIFVFTPREPEGHPWVIVEAMAAGLPIIATDRGAIIESVTNSANGFIVPVRNPEAIADKLKMLIDNPSLRKEMGLSSLAAYQSKFTEAHMVKNYSKAFDAVLSGATQNPVRSK